MLNFSKTESTKITQMCSISVLDFIRVNKKRAFLEFNLKKNY